MKNTFSIILLMCLHGWACGQIHVAGGTLKITQGGVVHTFNDVTNTGGGQLINEGSLSAEGNLTNSVMASLSGDGQYTLDGDWTNSADFAAGTSRVTFGGMANSTVTSGGNSFHEVEMMKTDADLLLADGMEIEDTLFFSITNNQIILGNDSLTFAPMGGIASFDNDNFIITNGSGELRKKALFTTAFVFPVGFDENTYNPITLVQSPSGTEDEYGVRVLENTLEDGTSGAAFTEGVVDASWHVTETVAGGSHLTLSAQWATSDEPTGFDRSECGIAHHGGNGWDLTDNATSAAAGMGPWSRQRSGMDTVGTFAIGGDPVMNYLALNPKIFLQGPFDGGLMNDDLRSQSLLPTDEPYAALSTYAHVGRGGGETASAGAFTPTGNDAIVDWVFLELRDAATPATVIATQSALLQRDGDIVDTNGTSEIRFIGLADADHFLVVRHRNHLGVRSGSVLSLSQNVTAYDFTTASSQANGTHPMANLGGSFGLWAGDVNGDGNVYDNLAPSDAQLVSAAVLGHPGNTGFFGSGPVSNYSGFTGVYELSDVDMDGNVYDNFVPSDRQAISNIILGHPGNTGFFGSGPVTNFSGVTEQIDP